MTPPNVGVLPPIDSFWSIADGPDGWYIVPPFGFAKSWYGPWRKEDDAAAALARILDG